MLDTTTYLIPQNPSVTARKLDMHPKPTFLERLLRYPQKWIEVGTMANGRLDIYIDPTSNELVVILDQNITLRDRLASPEEWDNQTIMLGKTLGIDIDKLTWDE